MALYLINKSGTCIFFLMTRIKWSKSKKQRLYLEFFAIIINHISDVFQKCEPRHNSYPSEHYEFFYSLYCRLQIFYNSSFYLL